MTSESSATPLLCIIISQRTQRNSWPIVKRRAADDSGRSDAVHARFPVVQNPRDFWSLGGPGTGRFVRAEWVASIKPRRTNPLPGPSSMVYSLLLRDAAHGFPMYEAYYGLREKPF